MHNTLTYRARQRNLELSLWVGTRGWLNSLLTSLLFTAILLTPVLAIIGMRLDWFSFSQALGGLILAGMLLGYIGQRLLWRRFGREIIEIGSGHCRIYSDYRLFKKLHAEVPFEHLDVSYWTAVSKARRSGNLVLKFEGQTLRSKVGLPRPELERAVQLVKRYMHSTSVKQHHMFVLHNN